MVDGAIEELSVIRERVKQEVYRLPDNLKRLEKNKDSYPVKFSPSLEKIKSSL